LKILTKPIHKQLLANSAKHQSTGETNFEPVIKLFGGAACTWLLTEIDEGGMAFGLCDLGHGSPELGYVALDEILAMKFPPFGLTVERDRYFTADKTIQEYAEAAGKLGRIAA